MQTNHVEKCCKRVIRIRKSKKDRQYNGQKKQENKRTNNDLQNTTQKTKDWSTRTPLKTGGELRCLVRVGNLYSCYKRCDMSCMVICDTDIP